MAVSAPARRAVKLLSSRVLHMSINPKTGEMDVLLRVSPSDLADRNAIHQAMKRGVELALAYHAGEEGPVYEAKGREYGDPSGSGKT